MKPFEKCWKFIKKNNLAFPLYLLLSTIGIITAIVLPKMLTFECSTISEIIGGVAGVLISGVGAYLTHRASILEWEEDDW